jgi:hypothetical protein
VADVPPGNTVVELVYRRLQDDRFQKEFGSRSTSEGYSNRIVTTAAAMTVIDMPWWPGATTTTKSVSLAAYNDQALVSRDALYSSRLSKFETQLEYVDVDTFAPGALREEHLASSVVKSASVGLSARKSDGGYSGFTYTNRRPNAGFTPEHFSFNNNPNRPRVTFDLADSYGWAMWGVRDRGHDFLAVIAAMGTGDDAADAVNYRVTDTGNDNHPQLVPDGEDDFQDEDFGFACLRGEWVFEEGRRRHLIVFADAGLLCIRGDRGAFSGTGAERAASNSGTFACFRLGFHIKGRDADDWVIPERSEATINQFCNWRAHGSDNHKSLATHAIASLMLSVRRPWRDDQGNEFFDESRSEYDAAQDVASKDLTIDAIALFVSGLENHIQQAPTVGLDRARLSAMLIDEGEDA